MSVLEVKGLVYAIGEKVLYENANFQLNKGEHMGIIGQNGVGKTTLINILIGNQEFNGGDVK
jgi:ATPase subunit of ABC transporter with duplicated ATPase domains